MNILHFPGASGVSLGVTCGACGEKGHTRTQRVCPKYFTDEETNRRETSKLVSEFSLFYRMKDLGIRRQCHDSQSHM